MSAGDWLGIGATHRRYVVQAAEKLRPALLGRPELTATTMSGAGQTSR